MPTELACRAVLFDADGVLVNSDASVDRAWRRWAVEYALDPDAVASAAHGRRSQDTVRLLIEQAEQPAALAMIDAYELEDAEAVTAVRGARELVASMPAAAWAIVTSGTPALANARLAAAEIKPPPVLVTASDVPQGKPAPDGYRTAASALGLDPAEVVVVEDADSGVRAARAAGVRAVLGVGARALATDADAVVADLFGVVWTESGLRLPPEAVIRCR